MRAPRSGRRSRLTISRTRQKCNQTGLVAIDEADTRHAVLLSQGQRVDFVKPYRGPPMTLGAAATAQVRLIVWCKECQHQVEPDPGEMATRYGADTSVLD